MIPGTGAPMIPGITDTAMPDGIIGITIPGIGGATITGMTTIMVIMMAIITILTAVADIIPDRPSTTAPAGATIPGRRSPEAIPVFRLWDPVAAVRPADLPLPVVRALPPLLPLAR